MHKSMNSDSWQSLKSGFMQIRMDFSDPPLKPAGRLKAIWNSFVKPRWTFEYLGGKDGMGATERFKWHAQKAAALLRYSGTGEAAVWFWLDQVSRDAPKAYVGLDHPQMKEILDVCGLSAEYCTKCEADAIRSQVHAQTLRRQRVAAKNTKPKPPGTPGVGRARATTPASRKGASAEDSGKVKEARHAMPQKIGKKKRGRPPTISEERKAAALQAKTDGGTNRDAAKLIYGTRYPTPQQVKNVPAILRHHKLKSKQS